jgi:hypothetical protein
LVVLFYFSGIRCGFGGSQIRSNSKKTRGRGTARPKEVTRSGDNKRAIRRTTKKIN